MSRISCDEFLNQLDVWLEGDFRVDARIHVGECPRCRSVVEDLESIARTAPALEIDETEQPSQAVWYALREQLEREGLIRQPEPESSFTVWWRQVSMLIPRPALAGAYLAILVAASFALSGSLGFQSSVGNLDEEAQNSTTNLSAALDKAEISAISVAASSRSMVTASLHKNLDIVDNYIALCEKSVREDPGNEIARDYLYEAYQQKADLLAQMSDRGVDGR